MSRPISSPDIFNAISDTTRRQILSMLIDGEMLAGDIFKKVDVSQSACSQHLRVLRDFDLVRQRPESTSRVYHLNAAPLAEAQNFTSQFEEFWSAKMDRLGDVMK